MEEIYMYDNDTYEKLSKEEKPRVIGKEKNQIKLLPVFIPFCYLLVFLF